MEDLYICNKVGECKKPDSCGHSTPHELGGFDGEMCQIEEICWLNQFKCKCVKV